MAAMTPVGRRRMVAAVLACTATLVTVPSPALADQRRDQQWYLKTLRIADVHRITKGEGVKVAVIDSGVWAAHPDFKGAVLPGVNINSKSDARTDVIGHGTSVASVIAARGRPGGRGVLGVAPAAEILPIAAVGSPITIASAINWAVDHGAKVINMSFGNVGSEGQAVAVNKAAEADIVLVAGSGNNEETSVGKEFPAAYPEVIAVGASGRNGKIAPFSHQGPQLDLVAPGIDIPVATSDKEKYEFSGGTSLSSAIVSGAAALIRSKYPDLSAAQVVEVLESTAVDRGPTGRDDAYGHGELDILAALKAASTLKAATPQATASATSSRRVIPGTAAGDDDGGTARLVVIGLGVLVVAGGLVGLLIARRRRA
jgi:type VII secretion-associated serine protease mycosin